MHVMTTFVLLFASLALLAAVAVGPAAAEGAENSGAPGIVPGIALVPRPVSVTPKPGAFTLTADTRLLASKEALPVARLLRDSLAPATGFDLAVASSGRGRAIDLRLDRGLTRLGPEGYRLSVTPERVEVRASAPAGLFYGTQTLLQLLPDAVFRRAPVPGVAWTVPGVEIEDRPRFGWRGMMLDAGRYFLPKEDVLKFLDLMALHKFNRFHFHLTEDQGWRVEIKKYPKLTEVGAWRKESMLGHARDQKWDGRPHGGFYTQDDLREIVAYAAARHITVVPEIEMPGHSTAAIAAYPELGNVDVLNGKKLEVSTSWGVHRDVLNAEESTVRFYQDVLTEVLDIFPSEFIHIGGDEAPKDQWKASPRAQALIKERGLKDEHELQSWWIRQMDQWLAARGRRLLGWDEILEGGLAPGAAVMSWRSTEGGIAAAKAGHDAVMAPNQFTYLDYYQTEDKAKEPVAIGGFLPLEKVYGYDPVPEGFTPEQAKHILGVQGQVWGEYVADRKKMEYMAFPRACALAEVAWSPQSARDLADFRKRLPAHLKRLDRLDVGYYRPSPK